MQWVSSVLRNTTWVSMVGAVGALCFHMGHPEEEAKKIALEASHFLTTTSAFSSLASNLWDVHALHTEAGTDPTLGSTRQVVLATQRQLRR